MAAESHGHEGEDGGLMRIGLMGQREEIEF
jgi:hypothetical protein